jgi:hypothetical protein
MSRRPRRPTRRQQEERDALASLRTFVARGRRGKLRGDSPNHQAIAVLLQLYPQASDDAIARATVAVVRLAQESNAGSSPAAIIDALHSVRGTDIGAAICAALPEEMRASLRLLLPDVRDAFARFGLDPALATTTKDTP